MLTSAYCPQRGEEGHRFVTDHSEGQVVCAQCGLVQQERIIDQTSEWRNFSAENQTSSNNPNRVGGPINPLFSDFGVSTKIQQGKGDPSLSKFAQRANYSSADKTMTKAIDSVKQTGSQIDLPNRVVERAIEMYKLMQNKRILRGKKTEAIVAAVIIWASRWEHCPKDVKEVIKATSTKKKQVYNCYKNVKEYAKNTYGDCPVNAKPMDWVPKYCNSLQIHGLNRKAIQQVCQRTHEREIVQGKNPRSIASASIYMVTLLQPMGITIKKIAQVAGLSDTTIRNLYRQMFAYRYQLIPETFKTHQQIKRMPSP